MQEEYRNIINELRPIDSPFFRVLGKHEDFVKEITEAIIERDITISHYETEANLENMLGRSIDMDLYVRTADDIHINIEAENSRYRASPKRARLHNSNLDASLSRKGQTYEELQDVYIVFLTSKRVFDDDGFVHHITRRSSESDKIFDDAVHIIYVNCNKADDSRLGKIAHDMLCSSPDDMISPVIRERVKDYKEKQGGEKKMCAIIDKYMAERLKENSIISKAEGKAEEKREIALRMLKDNMNINNVVKYSGLSLENVLELQRLVLS